MPFNYSIATGVPVITETGTDTDPSGIIGLTGVTDITSGADPFSVIGLGVNRLDIEGDLTINPEDFSLITDATAANAPNGAINVRNGGTLRLGVKTIIGTATKYTTGVAIIATERGNLNSQASIYVENGGTLIGNGADLQCAGIVKFANGSFIDIESLTITTFKNGPVQVRVEHSGTNTSRVVLNKKGLTLNGKSAQDSARLTTTGADAFDPASFIVNFSQGQYQPAAGGYPNQVFLDFNNGDNIDPFDFAYAGSGGTGGIDFNGNLVDFRNVSRRLRYTNANTKGGFSKTTKVVEFNLLNQSGGALNGVSYYAIDVNNGGRINFNSFDSTADIIYQGQNANPLLEIIPIIEFMAGEATTRFIDDRTNADTLTFKFVSYDTNVTTVTPNLIGLKTLNVDVVNPTDTSKSQVQSTVSAYTETETSAKVYDALKIPFVSNYTGQNAPFVSRSGILNNYGAFDIDFDGTGTGLPVIVGNKITVNLNGLPFIDDSITTGVINLINGAIYSGTRTDANGTVLPLRNIAVAGLSAGSRLCVYNQNTATQVFNQVVTGTSYTAQYAEGVGYSAGDVLELKVAKINMLEFSTSVVVTPTGWNGLVSQETNAIYNAHGVDGSTVTGISWDSGNLEFDFNDSDNNINGADIGAWYYYFITTQVGIAEAFGALVWSQINKITNATNKVAITFDNVKTSPLQINKCWIDRDDGVSIISPTSNSIQINPPAVFDTSNDDVASIKAKTDLLSFTGTDVKSTLDGEEVVTDTASRDASKATTTIASNMRGTDGANTVVPTNETLTVAQNTKLMSLDTDNLDVAVSTRATKADADQALVDYNVDTKTNVKPSIPV